MKVPLFCYLQDEDLEILGKYSYGCVCVGKSSSLQSSSSILSVRSASCSCVVYYAVLRDGWSMRQANSSIGVLELQMHNSTAAFFI